MVKLDENNEVANIEMPNTNFKGKDFLFFKNDFLFSRSLLRKRVYFSTLLLCLS
jgi:hypothetical protein